MNGIKYAFVRDGIVEYIEERTLDLNVPLSTLYHPDIIRDYFIEIPNTLDVKIGWLYENGTFKEPPIQPVK